MIKRSMYKTLTERNVHRLKDIPGKCIQKVALELENRTLVDRTGKVSFHDSSPLMDVRDI